MKITISQEGTSPISITVPDNINNKPEVKSQEGILAGIGIAIGVFFTLGILSAIIDAMVDSVKFKKAYNQLTEEQKQKLKVILKETQKCMLDNCTEQTELLFKKFKNKIISDKSELKKIGLGLVDDSVRYKVWERGNKNNDKINKHSLDLLDFCNIGAVCLAETKMLDEFDSDYDDCFEYTSKLDDFMNASNIDDEAKPIKFTVKNINNNVLLTSSAKYGVYEDHSIRDKNKIYEICYDQIFGFNIDKAKSKKEIGFFLDLLK